MNTKSLYNSPLFDDEEDEKKQKAPEQFSEKFLKTRQTRKGKNILYHRAAICLSYVF